MPQPASRYEILEEFRNEIGDQEPKLDALVEQIQVYGKVVNLTGSLKAQAIWNEIGEALLAYRTIQSAAPKKNHWIDIGSGGGLPGLVFGILGMQDPDSKGCLVEPRKRRIDFLSLAILQLGIPRLEALRATLNEEGILSAKSAISNPDWVSARAVFSPEEWRRRSLKAWPNSRCMVHGRAAAEVEYELEQSAEWRDQRIEIWRLRE